MWCALSQLQECINSRSEELIEYVPEALKNLLLVMASRGILTEQWQVRPTTVCLRTSHATHHPIYITRQPSEVT